MLVFSSRNARVATARPLDAPAIVGEFPIQRFVPDVVLQPEKTTLTRH